MKLFNSIKTIYTKLTTRTKDTRNDTPQVLEPEPIKYLTIPDEDVKRIDTLMRDVTGCLKGETPKLSISKKGALEVSRIIGLLELIQVQTTAQLRVFYSNLILGQFSIQVNTSNKVMLLAGVTYFRRKHANPPSAPLYH